MSAIVMSPRGVGILVSRARAFPFLRLISMSASINLRSPVSSIRNEYRASKKAFCHGMREIGIPKYGAFDCRQKVSMNLIRVSASRVS